jgi:Flp pilus assembly protein TadG
MTHFRLAAKTRRLLRDRRGGTLVEAALLIPLVFLFLFGAVEFLFAFHQWNRAMKAVERGARIAIVSSPVDAGLSTVTDTVAGLFPGDALPANHFRSVCSGATARCAATAGGVVRAPSYDAAAMRRIVFGRGARQACGDAATPDEAGMCDLFPAITPANVVVEYAHTGLGFVGRPGGPVPSVTVSLTGLVFRFFFLDALAGLGPIRMPPMRVTLTGEDLLSTAPPER